MLMHIALLELRSPPTAQKLQSNAYMRTSLCVPEVIISRLQMPVYTRPVPPDSTGVEFPKYSLPDSLIIEQTWGRLFGRFETRKSPEALLIILGKVSSNESPYFLPNGDMGPIKSRSLRERFAASER